MLKNFRYGVAPSRRTRCAVRRFALYRKFFGATIDVLIALNERKISKSATTRTTANRLIGFHAKVDVLLWYKPKNLKFATVFTSLVVLSVLFLRDCLVPKINLSDSSSLSAFLNAW